MLSSDQICTVLIGRFWLIRTFWRCSAAAICQVVACVSWISCVTGRSNLSYSLYNRCPQRALADPEITAGHLRTLEPLLHPRGSEVPWDILPGHERPGCLLPERFFLAPKREAVVWASYSRLQADLNCIQELLQRTSSWKYVINLTGQGFPLKINLEMLNILQIYNGSKDNQGTSSVTTNRFHYRFVQHWELAED